MRWLRLGTISSLPNGKCHEWVKFVKNRKYESWGLPKNKSRKYAILHKFTREGHILVPFKHGKYNAFLSHDYMDYEVATISSLPKNIGLFCRKAPEKRLYSAKETNIFKEPTNHSHPISWLWHIMIWHRSLLQKSLRKETIFCKRDQYFMETTSHSHPILWLWHIMI